MSTELDQTDQFYSVNEMLSLCDAFWTIFMIEVAQQEHRDLTVEEVRDAISDDVDSYQKQMRARLENKEREQTKFGAQLERDQVVRDAQDAVSEALVGFAPSQ
jgi:regulator of sirC expression with transglutaminase-like and TPR domain